MSSERPSKRRRENSGSLKGKSSSRSSLRLSPAPTSSIEIDSSSDNATVASTVARISPLDVVPMVDIDQASFATEAFTLSPNPPEPISVAMPNRLGSASGRGLETSPIMHTSSSPSSITQAVTESERNSFVSFLHQFLSAFVDDLQSQDPGSGLFANAQNVLITGGTFINVHHANIGKEQMKTPITRRPNSSPLFVGRDDVLRKIFIHCADSKLVSRRSCLLWGKGGIGKTQICLKFIEEMSRRFSHVFWVDASSVDSITMSIRGISSISAAQGSCLDDSVESVLQWMSGIEEEWLIVFDSADNPPANVVEKFIPPGNRGNILITSRNRSMGRIVSSENIIEIDEMEEADAITLLLKASCLDASAEHKKVAKNIVTALGCNPLAVDQAGAYIEAGRCSIHKYLQQFLLHSETLMTDATFRGA